MSIDDQAPKITIKEVAEAASVSRSSVSNYLNQRFGNMSAETRQRIAQAIEDLGYRPNSAARQLKTGKVPMLGLLVPTVINPFFGELALAIEQAASDYNHRVLLCNTMRDASRELEFEEEMVAQGIRGIITVSPIVGRRKPVPSDLSLVAIDAKRNDLGTSNADLVNIDNEAATRIAVDYLVGLGHSRIAYVTDESFTFARAARVNGFLSAVKGHQLSDCPIIRGESDKRAMSYSDIELFEVGRRSVSSVLAATPRPTAIVALNDMIAVGILSELRQQNISVPDDISLVGIDDILLSRLTTPALTTTRQPLAQIAEAAVERLLARMSSPTRSSSEIVFQPELIVRQSTSVAAAHR